MILRSRLVLPVSQPPIQNGAVQVAGNRVAAVGSWKTLSSQGGEPAVDLGDSILLPGLVNAHCHLDYTGMSGMVPPQRSFTDWIKLITSAKAGWNYTEFAASWLQGARMLERTGTTTVADFEAVPELLPEVWTATPLRVLSFLELTGVKSRRNPRAIVREAVARIETLPRGRCRAALAPHAPYSTVPELLRLAAQTARSRQWPTSVHVSESAQEYDMFMHGCGDMYEWLRRNERDMGDCGIGSPIQHLERCGALGESLVAVHVNYLGENDAALLGKNKVSVVHCPRSHSYFQHCAFPLPDLITAGVNVCLGTDSLATVYKTPKASVELSMFEEMRRFADLHRRFTSAKVLELATVNGARALGLAGKAGEIAPGTFADVIAIPFAGPVTDVYDAVLQHRGPVAASLIDGRWAVSPNS
jgi:cytosine/adenosine deaminase-related metal-dependent hydrolase